MKAVKMEFEEGELVNEEYTNLTEAVVSSLEEVDFYHGRQDYATVTKLLESYGRLIDVLAEKNVIDVSDVNTILNSNFISIEES